ncbi:MAG: AraC family transcriptional regulator [Gammaproteobacteria bacterium]|uniref:AraC family transcriptional regulator n=1 Tax=Limnobacter sp. TaxID=2003368 RepID=UPI001D800A58|nr:AraC family transcriptional regulator [Limnobacter sp.]MBU0782398.1 AraC family transcriptional regulator [Gammaproteobacteria bacterium]MBU0849986.1 AraC family transcriptional regulator [Gammaproteobacteria bacterium]MBU1266778.1 AraC family transcriptional regulator [Gammaproteobacteria bacterium]MBU1528618.1 AraC family transcriptional regulator [Gammaproteobacteria bacterium]MBU1781298.1 AraC family transcriptional regulator [Gammaproteobacteria bacterium]
MPARRTVASVKILCELGVRLGSGLSSLLTGSSILPAQLDDPHLEIDPDQELQVIHNLVRLHGKVPGLGLMAGSEYHLTTYGIWGYALITSPTFRQAVELGLRYLDLTFAFSKVELMQANGIASIVLSVDHLPPAVRTFVAERDSSAIQVLQRELFGLSLPLHGMEFAFPLTGELAQYEIMFGCTPQFCAELNRASFDEQWLSLPLPKANETSSKFCEVQLETLLSRRRQRGGVSAWLRNKLLADISSSPSLEQIATDHFMTERTLRRRLTGEGTSFRDLLAEVRQTMAEELLSSTGLSVSEVSARLGYSSPSAFIHAFQKWHGCSPRQFLDTGSKQVKGN